MATADDRRLGVWRALVLDEHDPEGAGRVLIGLPVELAKGEAWARLAAPFRPAGEERGARRVRGRRPPPPVRARRPLDDRRPPRLAADWPPRPSGATIAAGITAMESALSGLIGTWRGRGAGEFPTMEPFVYEEEISFVDLGVPALVYRQRAWSPDDDELLHLETGLWRPGENGAVAATFALPRVTEVSEGSVVDGRIDLRSTSVARAAGGAGLVAVRRRYDLDGDEISYAISMAIEGVDDLTPHLRGALRRAA